MKLLSLQPNLKTREREIVEIDGFNTDDVLQYYKDSECLSIAMSKTIFEETSSEVPNSIPIFIPFLVDEWKDEDISIYAN